MSRKKSASSLISELKRKTRRTYSSKEKIQEIWEKAKSVDNFNKDDYRKGCFGAWM